MCWERDPLWAKARLFIEYALEHDRDDPRFGLWCALALEMVARTAISSVSPTLLAESDRDHRFLLHALGRGNPKDGRQSISSTTLFRLCETLFPEFTSEHRTAASALANRRNAELHSGHNAFGDYSTQRWLEGFYSCCKALTSILGETLESLLGKHEADEAERVLAVGEKQVHDRVRDRIARYSSVFNDRPAEDRAAAIANAEELGSRLARERHHRVKCPSCKATATVQGDPFGLPRVVHDDANTEVIVKQAVAPRVFSCSACGLRLESYAELTAGGVGDQYTRVSRYSPEEYYDLLNPEDHEEIGRIARDRLGYFSPDDDYDNE